MAYLITFFWANDQQCLIDSVNHKHAALLLVLQTGHIIDMNNINMFLSLGVETYRYAKSVNKIEVPPLNAKDV